MNSEATEPHKTVLTLPSDTEVHVERIFDAPRELVWQCYTDPELLAGWLGPRRLKMRVEEFDFRVGGEWRYIHFDDDGNEYVFFGEFTGMQRPDHIVQTFNYVMEPQPPASIDRVDFIELEGSRTRLVTNSTFEAKAYRDGMIQSGMEKGMNEGFERLDELLERRQS